MTDKRPDDRDIDEILASIDEMLSQQTPLSEDDNARKASVEAGIQASKAKLSLSSSPKASELNDTEIDDFLSLGMDDDATQHTAPAEAPPQKERPASNDEHPETEAHNPEPTVHEDKPETTTQNEVAHEEAVPRQRILLTEELLEPSAQEALPLWVEQDEPSQAKPSDEIQPEEQTQNDPEAQDTSAPHQDEETAFDMDESLETDTVYKLEPVYHKPHDDLDDHTELVEAMMEEVLEPEPDISPDESQGHSATAWLTSEELDDLVQAVSQDVSKQVNDHLQTWLPGLISISIKKHLDDLNNN